MENVFEQFKNCLQFEAAFCTAACPFHVNSRDFIQKISRENYNSAYVTYRDAVAFPQIVASLCEAPCKSVCPCKETGGAIELNLLERACLTYATKLDPNDYNVPEKNINIAVIGAGISGLACALRLCAKKYAVTIFEKTNRIGGHLWDELPEEVFMEDINRQFKFEKYTLILNKKIENLDELMDNYDVIYVATGTGGQDFGLVKTKKNPMLLTNSKYHKTAVFAGGSLLGKETIEAIADGLNNAAAIERYLQTGGLLPFADNRSTKMKLDPAKLVYSKHVEPKNDGLYTKEELAAEAGRCLQCQCDACRSYCDLTKYFNKWPLRIKDEVMATTLPGNSEIRPTFAKRLINTANLDGVLKSVCPVGIDLDRMILESRRTLHRQGKQPWVFHDYWLADMDSANGDYAALVKTPKGFSQSKFAYFPGCQLGASRSAICHENVSISAYA